MHSYTRTAIGLHWAIALLVLAALPLGFYMADLPLSPQKLRLYSYHKWIGVTVFALALVRLAWRLGHAPPPLPGSLPRWQVHAACIAHAALYVLIIVIPLSGWLYSSAAGVQTVWFGVVPLPNLLSPDKELAQLLRGVHGSLNVTLVVVVLLHVAAAFKHQLVDRDGVLARMLPFARNKTES